MINQEAIGWMQRWLSVLRGDGSPLELAILKAIEALKQPEQKKGEWRYDDNLRIYRCTICCHCSFLKYPYCMHCGAKMEGEQ